MSITNTLFPQGDFLNIRENAKTPRDYNIQVTDDLVRNLPGGAVKDFVAPAAAATLSLPYDAMQAMTRINENDINRAIDTAGMSGPKDIAAEAFGLAYGRERPLSTAIERLIGASGPLADRLSKGKPLTVNDLTGLDYERLKNPTRIMQDKGLATIPQQNFNTLYPKQNFGNDYTNVPMAQELKDYTNPPMAQQPDGLAAIYQQPGFEGYVPSFSAVDQQPAMVNQDLNLTDTGGINLPPMKEIAGNIIQDRLKSYALKKIGLDGLKGNILKGIVNPYVGIASMMPGNTNPISALTNLNTQMQSGLFGRSKTMSDYLAAKREQKAAQNLERQMQSAVADQERAMTQRAISGGQGQSIPDRNRGQVTSSPGFSSRERGAALHG